MVQSDRRIRYYKELHLVSSVELGTWSSILHKRRRRCVRESIPDLDTVAETRRTEIARQSVYAISSYTKGESDTIRSPGPWPTHLPRMAASVATPSRPQPPYSKVKVVSRFSRHPPASVLPRLTFVNPGVLLGPLDIQGGGRRTVPPCVVHRN